jgi:hypothetical protein
MAFEMGVGAQRRIASSNRVRIPRYGRSLRVMIMRRGFGRTRLILGTWGARWCDEMTCSMDNVFEFVSIAVGFLLLCNRSFTFWSEGGNMRGESENTASAK